MLAQRLFNAGLKISKRVQLSPAFCKSMVVGGMGSLTCLDDGGFMKRYMHSTLPDQTGKGKKADIEREPITHLIANIKGIIKAKGPMPIADYMKLALTSPIDGYYTRGNVIGREGDFITSPEISQMFGEMMGIWYIMQWQAAGCPQRVSFIELGPGKGTMMSDMLRISKRFPKFHQAISEVHLVEASPELRNIQAHKLGCEVDESVGQSSTSIKSNSKLYDFPVLWHHSIYQVDIASDTMPLVMAHEFFDALPIYRFAKMDKGWREIMVDIDDTQPPETPYHFRFVKSRTETTNTAVVINNPGFSDKYSVGDIIEVSPESSSNMHNIAKIISKHGGVGLVIDYGQDWTQGDTFRGIKCHKFANPLSSPGSMDLTADVDFSYLRRSVKKDHVHCYGPVEQGSFLHSMGIQSRLTQLIQSTNNRTTQENLVAAYKRLTDPNSMGRIYKVMAILSNQLRTDKPPVAFEEISREGITKHTATAPHGSKH
ncbi:hypothetical protein H4219_000129 [Mycoemilia scoparia]|uniref:Protein arginine methyltransferase NDUFAF7 n=1 Tax=Mycoemilia scoparia TaxID=417184 RepID=A0A9W8A7Q6_9FUNG|nr:hypothetical protein H4219_000129 [Mycoemilia scoparia]